MAECIDCGLDFTPATGQRGRPRKRCFSCSPAQIGKVTAPRPRPTLTCIECAASFVAARAGVKFCSPRCRSYWWFRKREADPILRLADRVRRQKRRIRAPRITVVECATCGQSFDTQKPNQTYCSADCRNRARNGRRRLTETPARQDFLLNGIVIQHGAMAPTLRVIKCVRTVGLMVACPWCEASMGAASLSLRVCAFCATEVHLNDEEVSSVHLVA